MMAMKTSLESSDREIKTYKENSVSRRVRERVFDTQLKERDKKERERKSNSNVTKWEREGEKNQKDNVEFQEEKEFLRSR